jgi:catechol 2,3-dioxygenase-like lactoylglutathione lyase family enzyme
VAQPGSAPPLGGGGPRFESGHPDLLDHVLIRADDRQAAERFYRTTLGALGIEPTGADSGRIEWNDFVIASADAANPPTRGLHVAFVAPSPDHVDEFWRIGIAAGYDDDGAPGERPRYRPDYYGAFLRDPDGNSAEAVHHRDIRRGGHIDHLWIRVGDLDAAVAFYTTIMPSTGLREGRRWEAGRQFRGAWATFSLVADGRPVTEHLHLAFPAPDRQAVEDFYSTATAAGYSGSGSPGERSSPRPGYAAAVTDPDGTTVQSVFREYR